LLLYKLTDTHLIPFAQSLVAQVMSHTTAASLTALHSISYNTLLLKQWLMGINWAEFPQTLMIKMPLSLVTIY
jgi:hypothetical protein